MRVSDERNMAQDLQNTPRSLQSLVRCGKRHVLKTWPEYFDALSTGAKTFEARKDDRNFEVGDELVLREYEAKHLYFTGREVVRYVSYILRWPAFGVEAGWCVMALSASNTSNSASHDRP